MTFSDVPAPDVTMGETVAFLQKQALPAGYSIDSPGESRRDLGTGPDSGRRQMKSTEKKQHKQWCLNRRQSVASLH